MATLEDTLKELNNHYTAASIALSINDYESAYTNFASAEQDARDCAEMELDKKKADSYLALAEEYKASAKKYLGMLKLSPEAEARLRPRKPAKGFDEFIGMDNIKDYLRKDILIPWQKHEMWKGKKNGLFVYGPYGCGKTTLVQSLIHELGATGYFIEPMKYFSVYNFPNIKGHMEAIFKKAEEKDNVVFYFEKPLAYFPGDNSKISKATTKFFVKMVKKEEKRVRKLHLNILFVAGSEAPDRLSPLIFKKGIFNDFVRIHRPDHEVRRKMIEERLQDVKLESPEIIDRLTKLSHDYLTKDVSRLVRSVKKMAKLYSPKDEVPTVTNQSIDKVMADFMPIDDGGFRDHVSAFENSLPKGSEIFNR